uniref:Transposase (putative) YhgA-like domain-containing protein n=1 Tax=Leptospirillum ferrodiazotrophum TaxID=412449 RepID=C6HXQ0_9BACT|nr:MAG: hypothetical protein UBAL3_93200009 [Leptospirillum ferrodiazotrophum]
MTIDGPLHDRFFKSTLGRPKRMEHILKAFLPPALSALLAPGSLVPLFSEVVGDSLDASLLDMAFEATFGERKTRIHVLVEHKSSPDPWAHFQILHYLAELWLRDKKESRSPIPFVPVLFYHGLRPWNLPTRLSEMLDPPSELLPFVPDYLLPVIDLGKIDDLDIREKIRDFETSACLLLLKHIFEGARGSLRAFLQETNGKNLSRDIIISGMSYVIGVHHLESTAELSRLVNTILKEEGMSQNVVELWMEELIQQGVQKGIQQGVQLGIEQGIQQGIQQGVQQGVRQGVQQGIRITQDDTIRKLLNKGQLSVEQIAFFLDLPTDRIREVLIEGLPSQNGPS